MAVCNSVDFAVRVLCIDGVSKFEFSDTGDAKAQSEKLSTSLQGPEPFREIGRQTRYRDDLHRPPNEAAEHAEQADFAIGAQSVRNHMRERPIGRIADDPDRCERQTVSGGKCRRYM